MKKLLSVLAIFLCWSAHASALLQTCGNTDNSGGITTISCSFASTPTVGHDIEVSVGSVVSGQVVVTDNQGNVYKKVAKGSWFSNAAIFQSAAITTSSGTFTVSATFTSSTKSNIAGFETSGTSIVDNTGVCPDGFNASVTTIVCTNTSVDAGTTDFVITEIDIAASATPTGPSGYTLVAAATGTSIGAAYRINSSALTDSATWTTGGGVQPQTVNASFGSTLPTVPHIVEANQFSSTAVSLFGVRAGNAIIVPVNTPGSAAPTMSDGVSYTQDIWQQQGTVVGSGVFSLFNASAGTHNLTVSAASTGTMYEVSGLPTTNSLDKTGVGTNAGSTGPVTATTATLSAATDFAFLSGVANGFQTMTAPSGWETTWLGSGATGNTQFNPGPCTAHEQPAAVTALSPSCGTVTSAAWVMAVATYKVAAAASCTHNGWLSSGAEGIPNGTTGSYWTPGGIFATPNCAGTPNYWQPPVGLFGPT